MKIETKTNKELVPPPAILTDSIRFGNEAKRLFINCASIQSHSSFVTAINSCIVVGCVLYMQSKLEIFLILFDSNDHDFQNVVLFFRSELIFLMKVNKE